jgi:hypothetical protein
LIENVLLELADQYAGALRSLAQVGRLKPYRNKLTCDPL